MYKLVIADDEDIIRQGIAGSICWEEFGFRLVGQAANGEEAWGIICENRPELVVSDIYMPYVDGIELAERIKHAYPDTIVVFLSGYNDFNYARKSIVLGVFRYLTKPVQINELSEVLSEVREEIDYRHKQKDRLDKIMEQVRESLPLLRAKFFKGLIHGQYTEEELCETQELFEIDLPGKLFQALLVVIDNYSEFKRQRKGTEIQLLRLSLADLLKFRLSNICHSFYRSYSLYPIQIRLFRCQ